MLVENKYITEFQVIYEKNYNQKISFKEAQEQLIKLMRLMEIIYQPISKKSLVEARQKQKILLAS
ncbi:MAG: hypothetical protein WC564_04040 [Patescibacteria group bacterium]